MLARLYKFKPWQAAIIIAVVGFVVFFTCLTSPFQGDDIPQIVSAVPVHSISHIRMFFEESTFYNGQKIDPLGGIYYRPLMTTVFSLIYTIFGAHTLYFHLIQLLFYIGSAFLLYLVFKYSFKPVLALALALIFLVHPLNSQVAYAIPSMQDALFFFFGILGLYLLLRFKSVRALIPVAICFLLSMFSKEMGPVFIIMSLLYLFWFNRERLYAFIGIMVLPVTLYLMLKINAVGFASKSSVSPIDNLNFADRLMTLPSIMLFYIEKFVFPWKLASGYYWTYAHFSIGHVLEPLLIDMAVIGLLIYLGVLMHKKATKAQYYTYLFFSIWAAIGIIPYLQILPLDMTACETWFYFSMAGVLGMIGMTLAVYPIKIKRSYLVIVALVLIALLGIRTAMRGLDWENPVTLSYADISASPDDYNADETIAKSLINQGKYQQAETYAKKSVNIHPNFDNYFSLGVASGHLGYYSTSMQAYMDTLKYSGYYQQSYENMCALTLVYGKPKSNIEVYAAAIGSYPEDSSLWTYLALFEDKYNNNPAAKAAINKAASYGQVSRTMYDNIVNNKTFYLSLPAQDTGITIH